MGISKGKGRGVEKSHHLKKLEELEALKTEEKKPTPEERVEKAMGAAKKKTVRGPGRPPSKEPKSKKMFYLTESVLNKISEEAEVEYGGNQSILVEKIFRKYFET